MDFNFGKVNKLVDFLKDKFGTPKERVFALKSMMKKAAQNKKISGENSLSDILKKNNY